MGFLKNSTLTIAAIVIGAIAATPTTAIATLSRPHRLPIMIAANERSQPMQLPDTGAQDDGWSCGPNSAARVLSYYGHDLNYATVRALTDKKLFLPQKFRNPLNDQWVEVRTGTPPLTLQQVMQRWEGDRVKRSPQTNFNHLVKLVRSGKPAIALVRVGGLAIPYVGAIPYLHWIVITGADPNLQKIYYTDTDSKTYSLSYRDFQAQWNLGLDRDVSMAIATIFKNNGVEARTIIWVDK
jgi:hypothetical protein